MHKPVSTEWSVFNSHWRPIFHLGVSQYDMPTFPMTAASSSPQNPQTDQQQLLYLEDKANKCD